MKTVWVELSEKKHEILQNLIHPFNSVFGSTNLLQINLLPPAGSAFKGVGHELKGVL
jgi:hypothetical protein